MINTMVDRYALKKVYVDDTKVMGMGLYLSEPVQLNDYMFRFDLNKMISSQKVNWVNSIFKINVDMFFKKTLNLMQKTIKKINLKKRFKKIK